MLDEEWFFIETILGYQGLTAAAAGVGVNFCYIFLLDLPFMDESYTCPWLTANSFFSLFLWWNFLDILLFQRLNHFATIRAWKSTSRLVYLERSGRPPFSTYTRAQAGRRVYQPSVFVTTNVCVCVCVSCTIIPFGIRRNDETPSALISILFLLFICPPLIERVESIVFTLLIYLPTFWV